VSVAGPRTVVVVPRVPWWGMISSAGSPALLVGGSTVAARLQPRSYNPVADTISSLAAVGAVDRWVMTWALVAATGFIAMTAWPSGPGRNTGAMATGRGPDLPAP
jgi:hypothetical protein